MILELPYLNTRFKGKKPADVQNIISWVLCSDKKSIVCGTEDGNIGFIIDSKGVDGNLNQSNRFV